MSSGVQKLRTIVQEGIRVQRGGSDPVDYIDAANAVRDAVARTADDNTGLYHTVRTRIALL